MQFFFKCSFIRMIKKKFLCFCLKYGSNIFMKSMLDFTFCCDINYGDIVCE